MNTEVRPTHWFSVLTFFIAAYLAIFAESSFDSLRRFIGVQIHLLPGLMVYAAVSFNVGVVISSAAILGLMFDAVSANPPGTTSIALLVTTFSLFYFRDLLLPEQLTAQFVLGVIASATVPILCVLILYGVGEQPLIGWPSLLQWFVVTAGGAAFTPVWFLLFNRLDKALRYKEVSETSFRADREIARGRSI
jgi:cell shape-determining protein MreD